MSTTRHYEAVVIGSGQGGGPLAQAFANSGRRTALIEAKHVGGTCINEGCTPTKTMVASARIAHLACRAQGYGVQFKRSSLTVNMETVKKRKRDIVDSFRTGSENRFKGTENLDLIMGKATFQGPKTVEVLLNEPQPRSGGSGMDTTLTVTGDLIFVNAGCSPSKLDVKNACRTQGLLDSTSVMELGDVPRHIVIVGGGVIGCEFAQLWRRFGAKVSLVQRAAQLLPREDADVADEVRRIFVDAGIDVYLGATTTEVSNVTLGQIVVAVKQADGTQKSLLCSHVLAAAGRTPNTADLGLASAGVELDSHGFIKVDEHLATSAPGVYALGDIKGGMQQTHVSYDDMRILRHNLVTHATSGERASIQGRLIPYTTFIDPQLGRVGMTEKEARALHPPRNVKVAKMPMAYVARALEMDETKGFMKGVVDADTKEILGFACLGVEGGEIMTVVQMAMVSDTAHHPLLATLLQAGNPT
jgi:pyruvate/2-oxoglutarate dehydrogenase complex dihydrolipoamide dehydrogenase (E3) component